MERGRSPKRVPINGPYKATQLWNDVIKAFRDHLPCGRHRRIMKTFDNCFSGSGAVDWLFNYLKTNKNFKTADMSREKAISLVNKLYKAGIFEEVKVSKNMQHKAEVQENRLYRFVPMSPSKAKIVRLPLAPRNDAGINQSLSQSNKYLSKKSDPGLKKDKPHHKSKEKIQKVTQEKQSEPKTNPLVETVESYPPCYLITKILTPKEIRDTWQKVFMQRLQKALGVTRLEDIIQVDTIKGNNIMHNCTYVSKNGTVTNIAFEDQLPHWVWSAMKCLARWPEPPEAGLPNYPGFEKDVFVVVKDYFLGLEEPLVPFSLYETITNVFVFAGNSSSHEKEKLIDSLWTTASLENVIMNLAQKYNLLDSVEESNDYEIGNTNQLYNEDTLQDNSNLTKSKELSYKPHFSQIKESEEEDIPSKCRRNIVKKEILSSFPSSSHIHNTNFPACDMIPKSDAVQMPDKKFGSMPNLKISKYETAFGPDNRTVTRVFYHNGICTDYKHCDDGQNVHSSQYFPVETHFDLESEKQSQFQENLSFERVKSLENVNACGKSRNGYSQRGNVAAFGRSKSFAGVAFPQGRAVQAQSQSSLMSSSENLFVKRSKRNTSSTSLFHEEHPISHIDSHLLKSQQQASHHQINERFNTPLSQEGKYVSDSLRTFNMHKFSNRPNDYDPSQSQTLPNCYRSPLKPHSERQRDLALTSNSMYNTVDAQLMKSSTNNPARTVHSPSHITKSSSHLDIHSPIDTASAFGPGYRPVLDASKGRRSASSVNLSTSGQAPARSHLSAEKRPSSVHQVTSTPLYPFSFQNQNYNIGSRQSAFNVSDLTPLYGSQQRFNCASQEREYLAYPQTRLSEDRAKAYLQLITLLIPPACRRKLHMLFKMMMKMIANPNLCLDPTQSTRSLVLGTFYVSIIRPQNEDDLDDFLVLQLVSFMLDFYDDIFTPPEELKSQVTYHLKQMQRPQITFSPRPVTSTHFCQRTTVTEYEKEKKTISERAIEDLLENIIQDRKMEPKTKRMRLKQFRKTYPQVYARRFPNPDSESMVMPPRPKIKDALIAKPLSRLKGLRL